MKYWLLLLGFMVPLFAWSQMSRAGKDRALFFAVNEYEDLTNLQNPIKDAEAIAKELQDHYGFATEVVPNPNLEDIETKIRAYQSAYQSGRYPADGQLLIFFSGHGIKSGGNGYFMPADADSDRPYATAIEYGYWRSTIDQINCQHILVAVDACHSARFDPTWKNKTDPKFIRPGEAATDRTLLNHEAYRARLFFTSDAKGEQTPDRSTFARQLLEGLRTDESGKEYLTSSVLFASYLKKAAPTPRGGTFGVDEPGSCFLFFRKPKIKITDAREDRLAWQKAQQENTLAAYQNYVTQFPQGDFRPLAEQQLADLEAERQELLAWQRASSGNTVASYRDFIREYPKSPYKDLAELKIEALGPAKELPSNMVFVKGGSFEMGDSFGDGYSSEKPVHTVRVSDFYMSKYEVTFAEYDAYCNAQGMEKPADEDWGRGTRPVINVSWNDAIAYCNWRSEQEGYRKVYRIDSEAVIADWTANGYRLPTEAEWEYAVRNGGGKYKYAGTSKESELGQYANFCDQNCSETWKDEDQNDGYVYTAPVGSLKPNGLGLYDMSGNVWEWCWDWYAVYDKSKKQNPKGPSSGSYRVHRGGSWSNSARLCGATYRSAWGPADRYDNLGFRVVRSLGS